MPLSRHQERILNHTVDRFRRANPVPRAHHAPAGAAWVPVATGEPCRFDTGSGMSVPKEVGRVDYDIILTADKVHFGLDSGVDDGDLLRNTTPGDPRQGLFFLVQGEPQLIGAVGRRYPGSKTVMAARLPAAPPGVR